MYGMPGGFGGSVPGSGMPWWNAMQRNINGGRKVHGEETLENLDFNGTVELTGTHVNGPTTVNGLLNMTRATLQKLEVNGTVESHDSRIGGETVINGLLNAFKTIFLAKISIASERAMFRGCNTKDILVRRTTNHNGQEVHLLDETVVAGDITFENGSGHVYMSNNSRVVGRIVGGTAV